jgi:hypothetical protein
VNLTVTTVGGTSATSSSDQFTYVAAPTVTGVSPNAGPLGGGTSVVITGTNLGGATAVMFGSTAATSFTVNSAGTQITATSPAEAAGTVNLTVTTVGGTSATSSSDQFTYVAAPTVTGVSPNAGPLGGGTSVVITGTNLNGATAVKFGTVAGTITSDTATRIVVRSPAAAAGTVDITVITARGTSVTSSVDRFAYVAAPTVTGVSPSSGPTKGGTSVVITGTNLLNATAVTFGGTAATSFVVNSAGTQITAVSPAKVAGTVNVTVTTAGGTSITSSADRFTYVAAPTVTGVSPSSGPTGGGTSVTITGTNLGGATAVKFGSVSATITSDTATRIVARSPAGTAGMLDVTVVTAGGASATSSADRFTYTTVGAASAVTLSSGPASGNAATGGTNLTGATVILANRMAAQIANPSPAVATAAPVVPSGNGGGDASQAESLPTETLAASLLAGQAPTVTEQTVLADVASALAGQAQDAALEEAIADLANTFGTEAGDPNSLIDALDAVLATYDAV